MIGKAKSALRRAWNKVLAAGSLVVPRSALPAAIAVGFVLALVASGLATAAIGCAAQMGGALA